MTVNKLTFRVFRSRLYKSNDDRFTITHVGREGGGGWLAETTDGTRPFDGKATFHASRLSVAKEVCERAAAETRTG